MQSRSFERWDVALTAASVVAAALTVALGAVGLAGWLLDSTVLLSLRRGWPAMRPNSALGLICAGLSLVLLAPQGTRGLRRAVGLATAVLVLVLGLFTTAEWAVGLQLGIDSLLAPVHPLPAAVGEPTGRPAALTGVAFALSGAALVTLGLRARWSWLVSNGLAIAVGLIGYLVLVGYAHGVVFRPIEPANVGMALATAAAFVALALALQLIHPHRGLMAEVTAETAGGMLARRLVLAALAGPPVLGLVALRAFRAGWLSDENVAFAILSSAIATSATVLLLRTARALNRADRERLRGEEARARLAALVSSSADAIVALTPDENVTDWNAAAERMYGWRAEEMIGGTTDRIVPADRSAERDELLAKIRRGERVESHETVRLNKSDERIDVSLTLSPIAGMDGRIVGISEIARDIRRVKQLERLREEWMAVIAHDLRQPLAVMKLAADVLERAGAKHAAADRESAAIGRIVTATERLDQMVDDLLDASRIEAHRLALHRVDVDPTRLVQDIVDRVGESLAGHRIRVRVGGALHMISVDPARIEQVLGNVVSNAVKYGAPRSPIDVVVSCSDRETIVSVTNRGPGLTPEERERLFTRFYRARASRVEGLGLGLYISKGIIEAHGGRIWVESIPEETTTFSFALPNAVPAAQTKPEGEELDTPSEPPSKRPRALRTARDRA